MASNGAILFLPIWFQFHPKGSILNLNIRWTKELDDVKITLRFMNVTKQCSDSAGIREEDDRDVI